MPPTRSNTSATVASPPQSASPEPQPGKELPERSRNAKAQARHREKRKAYISHLEQSVASLKQQLATMGISGAIPAHALASSGSTGSQAETDARLRELVEENERLKSEIQRLRSRVESMSGGSYSGTASASSRSSTGGNHHGLTPPATPGVLGGLGASTGGLLPADEAAANFDGRRGSVMGGPVESFLASAFVPFLTISPPPTASSPPPLQRQPPHLFASSSPSSSSLLGSPYAASAAVAASPFYNSSATPSPYPSNSPSPIPSMGGAGSSSRLPVTGHPSLSFAQYGSSSSSESSYSYPSSSSRLSLQSFAIM